jgi:hypothetical protein
MWWKTPGRVAGRRAGEAEADLEPDDDEDDALERPVRREPGGRPGEGEHRGHEHRPEQDRGRQAEPTAQGDSGEADGREDEQPAHLIGGFPHQVAQDWQQGVDTLVRAVLVRREAQRDDGRGWRG